MDSSQDSFGEHVGYVLFPRRPNDLTDVSLCPACFESIPTTSVCANCGLDLNHPDAGLLREESLNVAALMNARIELIGKIRFETAAERARLTGSMIGTQPHDTDQGARGSAPTANTTPPASTPSPSAPASEPPAMAASGDNNGVVPEAASLAPARQHSGIQVLLLVVGVSLLSVGAIFFLVFAFLTFGLIWRSALIAGITIASIVAASKMKSRGLSATAEALSVLAVVFVVLDIFALRANDLVVVGDPEGRLYWGGALVVASLGFMFWHRASGLTLVNIVGFSVFPPAVALVVAGLISDREFTAATFATLTAFAAAALIHVTAAHGNYRATVERAVTLAYAMFAFVVALISVIVERVLAADAELGGWLVALAAIAAVHSAAAHATRLPVFARNLFAATAGLLLGVALWNLIVDGARAPDDTTNSPVIIVAIVVSLTVAALLAEASGLRRGAALRSATRWGSLGLWAISAMATLVPLTQSALVALQFVLHDTARRITPGSTAVEILNDGWPQVALITVPAVMTLVWWFTAQLRRRIHVVIASAGVALTLIAPLTGTLLSTVLVWLALTTLALAIIAGDRRRRGPRRIHLTVAAGGLLPLLLAYGSGWSSHETWALVSVVSAVLLIAARYLVKSVVTRATMLGAAAVVFLLAAGGIGEQLQFALTNLPPNRLESWLTVTVAAVAVVALALWVRAPFLQSTERRTLWWIGVGATALAGGTLWVASVDGAPFPSAPLVLDLHIISAIVAITFVALLGFTMLNHRIWDVAAERFVAAALLAPATVWALDGASRVAGLGDVAIELAPATASVLVGVFSMALRVRAERPRVRRISELSALVVAGLTAASVTLQPHDSHWLITLLVAVTLLLVSIARDGIFGSRSPRRHVIWAAVAFATWSLWLRLDQTRVDALEAYVLPLASAVLLIAFFTARAELREARLKSAPTIALVGLLVAIPPLAVNAATGTGLRTLVIAGLCGALLLIVSFVEPPARLLDFWGVAIVASGIGIVLATAARALVLLDRNRGALPELDSWVLGGVAILALASFGLVSSEFPRDIAQSRWAVTSEVLLGTAIVLLYAIETLVLLDAGSRDRPLDNIRVVVLVALGGVFLLLSTRRSIRPLTHRISYLAFGLASVVGLIAYFGDLIRPLEWVTVILGGALLVHGGIRLTRDADARSVRLLSVGLALILLPSLFATFVDAGSVDTRWRIVALGIACVLAIVAGTWLKLQAPLLFGTVVVLIHAAHTFAPAIVTLYQLTDWWVWAVAGGAIVLFLGITLERRIRDLKTLNTKFSALR